MSKVPDDKRSTQRFNINMPIQLRWGNEPPTTYQTRDMSDTGLFIISGPKPFPTMDTEVFVRLTDAQIEGETPWVRARVARIDEEGIAIQLLDL